MEREGLGAACQRLLPCDLFCPPSAPPRDELLSTARSPVMALLAASLWLVSGGLGSPGSPMVPEPLESRGGWAAACRATR